MDEETLTKSASFADVKRAVTEVLVEVCDFNRGAVMPVAAE